MEIVLLIVGLIAGGAIGFLVARNMRSAGDANEKAQVLANTQLLADAQKQKQNLETELKQLQEKNIQLSNDATATRTEKENLIQKLAEQKTEAEVLQKKFAAEFENLANRIFDEKGKKFADQNKQNLDQLLNPFQQKIKEFEEKVEKAYDQELRDKTSLREEVRKLNELNKRISDEANNLTNALKGSTKKQGNWGETILERVLEQSGLRNGVEYVTQFTTTNDSDETIRPDVIVNLPDNKHIIIDAKVSLLAYEQWVNEEDETQREKYLADHLTSVRNHIKLLSDKNYFTGKNLRTPDFVLLFMPIESAFALALQSDVQLYQFAWEKKIVMVSPTTLLATLMTVASLWKFENQNKNHVEIARLAGELYNKMVGFTEDMISVGGNLDKAKKNYEEAMNKFSTGTGNAIRTAEKVKELGAKVSKNFNQTLLDRSSD